MNYSVYIIYSGRLDRYYTGTTDDFVRRLEEHNTGLYEKSFSAKGVPWVEFLLIEGLSSQQAYEIEAHIKRMKSRKYMEDLKTDPNQPQKGS